MLAAPAAAEAEGWLPYKFASPEKVEGEEVHVGADAAGNVFAIWRNDTNFHDPFGTLTISSAVLASGAAQFGPPTPIETLAGAGSPRIGVMGNGNAVAVWERNTGGTESKDIVEGATRTSGIWNSPVELTDSGDQTADYLTMEMAPNGQGLVAWRVEGSPRKNKVRTINTGNFAPAPGKAFDTSPYPGNNEPDVAVSADGSRRYLAGHKWDVGNTRLNLYTFEGIGWDSGAEIANPTSVPQVAAAPNGEAVLAWIQSNDLKVKRGSGEPVTVGKISGGLSLLDLAVGPATAEFPGGMVLVTWRTFVDDGTATCCYQARAAVGTGFTMGPQIELSDELEEIVNNPAVQAAIGPDGAAYAGWTRFDGSFWVPQVSIRRPGEAFDGVPDDLSAGDAYITDLQVAPDGRALVGLRQIDEVENELYWRAAVSIYQPGPSAPKAEGAGPSPAAPPVAGPPPADTAAPKLKLQLSRKTFATGARLNKVAVEQGKGSYIWKKLGNDLKVGTRLLATLNEPATLTIRVDKTGCVTATPGNPFRTVSGRCRQADPNLQHRTAQGAKGLNRFTYLGDWAGTKLGAGARYEFEVIARDRAGNASKPQRIAFVIDGDPKDNGF